MSSMSSQPPSPKRARRQVSLPYTPLPPSLPTRPGSPTPISSFLEGSPTAEDHATREELIERRQVISIVTLPEDVLLAIFGYFVNVPPLDKQREGAWQSLVHVCRRWRSIVFRSPRHLNLQLVCGDTTPARDTLDVWPAFPLVILWYGRRTGSVDNIIVGLERRDRVCKIYLANIRSSVLEILSTEMQQPYPELSNLLLHSKVENFETLPVVPDSFLGGSAPRLEALELNGIPFPGFPKLLLSATQLVELRLFEIPHSGYISPDVMVTALSMLISLEELSLEFHSPRSCPDRASRHPPPSTRSVLPILRYFRFKGVTEYLEDLVARVDAPRLNSLSITFFNDTVFDTPQLMQFISRTPTSRVLEKAHIRLRNRDAVLDFSSRASGNGGVYVIILLCRGLDWQLSSVEQVCASCLPSLSVLEDLQIYELSSDPRWQPDWEDDIENELWLGLLHPFTSVKNLYLSEQYALRIGPALQELVGGRMAEMLPTLQNIFLKGLEPSGPIQEGIGQFVASRQATSRPIAVSRWDDSK